MKNSNPGAIALTISAPGDPDRVFLEKLYLYSFPPEERRPWHLLTAAADDPSHPLILYKVVSGGHAAGLLTLWRLGPVDYIEHFAIDGSLRGGGIGSAALKAALEASGDTPVVLEVEPVAEGDTASVESRRVGFYRRHGFTDFPRYRYIQPPYMPGLPEVTLTLMCSSPQVDLDMVTRLLHSRVYGVTR